MKKFTDEIEEAQYNALIKNFNLDEVWEFTKKHRLEIMRLNDSQYGCFIDAWDGCYSIELDPLSAMAFGILAYKKMEIEQDLKTARTEKNSLC